VAGENLCGRVVIASAQRATPQGRQVRQQTAQHCRLASLMAAAGKRLACRVFLCFMHSTIIEYIITVQLPTASICQT